MAVRRVSVDASGEMVDVTLPASAPVASYFAALLELIRTRCATNREREGGAPTLRRFDGSALDVSQSLADSSVVDGDVLVLTYGRDRDQAQPPFDPTRHVIAAAPSTESARTVAVVSIICCATGLAGLLIAVHAGVRYPAAAAAAGCVLAVVAVGVALRRRVTGTYYRLLWCVVVTLLVGMLGYLTVPGAPAAPNILLCVTAAAVTAVATAHVAGYDEPSILAVAMPSAALSLAALAAVLVPAHLQILSAAGTLIALYCVSASARIAMSVVGVAVLPPDGRFGVRHPTRAARAARISRGLVIGASLTAAVGVTATSLATVIQGESRCSAAVFAALVAAALLLRTRLTSSDTAAAGTVAAGAVVILVVVSWPAWGVWLAALAVVAPSACLARTLSTRGFGSPTTRRHLDLLSYVTLAATVPAAVWVADLYTLMRGLDIG